MITFYKLYNILSFQNQKAVETDSIETIHCGLAFRSIGYQSRCVDPLVPFNEKSSTVVPTDGKYSAMWALANSEFVLFIFEVLNLAVIPDSRFCMKWKSFRKWKYIQQTFFFLNSWWIFHLERFYKHFHILMNFQRSIPQDGWLQDQWGLFFQPWATLSKLARE